MARFLRPLVPVSEDSDRFPPEQVAELFRTVSMGVLVAAIGALVLAGSLVMLGEVEALTGAVWSTAVIICAALHLGLRQGYLRAKAPDADWRFWGWAFTAIALIEGLAWGWASLNLAPATRFDLQMLVQVVVYACAAGAVPAFGSYLPAFFAFYVPTVLPYSVRAAIHGEPLDIATVALSLVYIIGMVGLALRANQNFLEGLRLRFEKERLAESLQAQKDLAEQANLAKSRFLASASHDLRQPMHALSLFVGALRGLEMEDEARRLVGHVEGSVTALDSLFASLLDISRLDAGVVQSNPQSFAIQPLLERICREHAGDAAEKGICLRLLPCSAVVQTDPLLLERILRNLVSNAVRHTDSGRVLVGCRRGQRLRIEVRDTGRGIPAALSEQVFQEFFQIGNPERDRAKGLGLGLAIVKRLAALLDLPLDFRSVPGRGSVFSIAVPLGRVPDTLGVPAEPAESALPRGLILVIDDEVAIQEGMRSLLSSWGHEVIVAGSGAEMLALTATCPTRPDLIICDYRLRAAESGIEVIRRLQSEFNEDIPAVLVTGDSAPERLLEARDSGLMLLHKPVANARLRAAISHLMSARPEPAEAAPE